MQFSKYKPPGGLQLGRGVGGGGCDLAEGFLRHRFGGLIFGGAYFWNFTVLIKFF